MDIVIKAQLRDISVDASSYRADNLVPAVCYGPKKENLHVVLEHSAVLKAYREAFKNTVVKLDIDGKMTEVLFYNVEYDYLTDRIQHIDFYLIDPKSPVIAEVPLSFDGVSLAVVNLSCILNPLLETIKVKCLPKDLPSRISVDIAKLVGFDSVIKVADIELAKEVTVLTPADRSACGVIAPRGVKKGAVTEEAAE